jgi:hypothetical protein
MRKMWTVILLLAPLLVVSTVLAGPTYSPESLARYFRLDWGVSSTAAGPKVEGYVYNQSDMRAINMRLNVEELDPSGKVVGQTTTWVLGELAENSRSFFSTRVHQAASYRVTVSSFSWLDKNVGN